MGRRDVFTVFFDLLEFSIFPCFYFSVHGFVFSISDLKMYRLFGAYDFPSYKLSIFLCFEPRKVVD